MTSRKARGDARINIVSGGMDEVDHLADDIAEAFGQIHAWLLTDVAEALGRVIGDEEVSTVLML